MRCTSCKAYVPFDSKLKKCPACGTPIDKKPFMEDIYNMIAEFCEDKNFIFWAIFALVFWAVIGGVEFGLGGGRLLDYFESNIFHSLVLFIFWGFAIEQIAKTNAQIRLASRTVILKERRNLRIFRIGSNLSIIAGLGLSAAWVGPSKFFAHFPGVTLITVGTMCLFWAIEGMYFNEEHFEDHRVRNFFILLGIRHPHSYRVVSAWFLSGTILALVIFWGFTLFPSILLNIYETWFVQSTVKAVKSFLDYFPTI
jgi:hypothetical protein